MHPADRAHPGKTLVRLQPADAMKKGRLVAVEIALPELLGEIAAMIDEPLVADHLDVRNRERRYLENLHELAPCHGRARPDSGNRRAPRASRRTRRRVTR